MQKIAVVYFYLPEYISIYGWSLDMKQEIMQKIFVFIEHLILYIWLSKFWFSLNTVFTWHLIYIHVIFEIFNMTKGEGGVQQKVTKYDKIWKGGGGHYICFFDEHITNW